MPCLLARLVACKLANVYFVLKRANAASDPAQMFCDKRVMHNVRNGWDIAKFLAEPTLADMMGHHANLK